MPASPFALSWFSKTLNLNAKARRTQRAQRKTRSELKKKRRMVMSNIDSQSSPNEDPMTGFLSCLSLRSLRLCVGFGLK
jgi:hypothetical protein